MKTKQSENPAMLFDLDGTLIDSVYEHVIAWGGTLQSVGIVVPYWKIHRRIGMNDESMIRQLLREHKIRQRGLNVAALEKKHAAAFKKAGTNIALLPGTEALLRYLSRSNIRWAIATTGSHKQTTDLLGRLKLPQPRVVITGDDVENAKPSPDVFVLAAKRLNVPIENCIVVGDSPWDMLAAGRRRALGVGILAGGYGKAELEESGAFRVYSDPAEMLSHLEDLGVYRK